VGIW